MFNGSKGATIQGGAHNTVGRDQNNYAVQGNMTIAYTGDISQNLDDPISEANLKLLAQKAAPNACYDSEQRFPPPNCHPGTRASILEELSKWIEDDSKATRIFWLYGSAGVGKSAIAQNLAEKYASRRLAATFFFSRNDSSRDKLDPFVASLAYQFCRHNSPLRPALGQFIIKAIRSDPNIFHTSFEMQFEKLIIEPCSKVNVTEWVDLPNVIIVDGLDECIKHPSQERLLAIIHKFTAARRVPQFPVPWIILICSRPEPQIRDSFDDFGTILRCFDINSSDEAYRDIQKYFSDQFAILRKKHRRALRHEGKSWPSEEAVYQLLKRADRQFIFAATVIKYIDTRDERPQDRLDIILRIYVERELESPYSDLDLLYHQILSTCHRWEKVQPILRLLVTPHYDDLELGSWSISWRSPAVLAHLLDLKKGEVETILSRLHSVLQIPEDCDSDDDDFVGGGGCEITHASFTEFLSDPHRSGKYYTPKMPRMEYFDCVATLLLRTFVTWESRYPLYHPPSNFMNAFTLWETMLRNGRSVLVQYSCRYWHSYCGEVKSPSPSLVAALNTFNPYPFVGVHTFHYFLRDRHSWSSAIKWAKVFGESTEHFVNNWESLLREFWVALPPAIPRREAFWWTFEWEYDLLNDVRLGDFQRALLRELYPVEPESMESSPRGHALLILPADSHAVPPEDWSIVHIAKNNADVFKKVTDVLKDRENGLELLLEDVQENTRATVSQNLVQADDLNHLKLFLKARAEIFGLPFRTRTRGMKRKRK